MIRYTITSNNISCIKKVPTHKKKQHFSGFPSFLFIYIIYVLIMDFTAIEKPTYVNIVQNYEMVVGS
jgi:hypothetical protein